MPDRISQGLHQDVIAIPKWFIGLLSVIGIPVVALVGHLALTVNSHESMLAASEADRGAIKISVEKATELANSQSIKINEKIDSQTKEIISLRLQIERLLVVRPSDVYQKTQEMDKSIQELRKLIESTLKNRGISNE
jgi:hypothetical protein